MLVHRRFQGYTGGHGKMLDYMRHVQAHARWDVLLHLSATRTDTEANPFCAWPNQSTQWRPQEADALLIGGMDWTLLAEWDDQDLPPVINLVQHVRHADPSLPLRAFLKRPAIRICVSHAVRDAIVATGEVHGPVHVIPLGIDVEGLGCLGDINPTMDVFIDGVKQPDLARCVHQELVRHGLRVRLHDQRTPRSVYLRHMALARIVVALPDPEEGFYLPGLEAMAMGRALVQPDCLGSREYVRAQENARVPERRADAIAAMALDLARDAQATDTISRAARLAASRFTLAAERAAVHALLDTLDGTCT